MKEGFWLGNNIMWTAVNTYQTIQQFFYNCIRKLQVKLGGAVRTPCTLPLDPPL